MDLLDPEHLMLFVIVLRLLIPVYAKQKTFPWKTLLNEIFIGVIQLSIQIKCFDKLIEIP